MSTEGDDKARPAEPEKKVRTSVRLFASLSVCLVVCLVVGALVAVGRATREGLRRDDRFTVGFAAIDCQPPPPLAREEFLAEVQYLAGLPESLSLLDEELSRRLAEAFARHPWVRRVERVDLARPGRVRVRLEYRKPTLAVPVDGTLRAVDREGVLLPIDAGVEGLPVFRGSAAPPAGPAGTRWGDPAVEQAAGAASG